MIRVEVYTRDNTIIDVIPDAIDPKFQEALNEPGAGSVSVPLTSAALVRNPDLLDFGRIVKMTVNGHTFAWLIEQRNLKVIDGSENAKAWELSGRGVLALLADAAVFPEHYSTQAQYLPKGKERWFSFPAFDTGWYDDSMWGTPQIVVWAADDVEDRAQHPVSWPDEAASWMWLTDPTAHANADTAWFRTTLTTTVTERFDIYASGDDGYSLFIDGQLLMQGSSAKEFQTMRITLAAGVHTFAIIGTNGVQGQAGANPAGVIFTMIEVDTTEHEVRLHSSSAWRCISGNADPLPGFNPGRVIADLIDEASTRGVTTVDSITVTWDDSTDSEGDPWPDTPVERAFDLGTDLLAVCQQLAEQSCYIAMDADLNLTIRTADSGADLTTGSAPVVLRKAHNVLSEQITADGSGIKTAILTLRDGVATDDFDAVAEAAYGRRESFIAIGNTFSEKQAETLREWAFTERGAPKESITIGIRDVPAASPFTDFVVGDYVLAPDVDGDLTGVRIMSIAAAQDDAGNVSFAPELSAVLVDRGTRMQRWVQSMTQGTMGGEIRSASPTHQAYVQTSGDPASANTTRYEQSSATGPADSPHVFYMEKYPIFQSETVFRNGLMQRPDTDYVLIGKAISMTDEIAADDEMAAHFAYSIIQPAVVENQIATAVSENTLGVPAMSQDGRWHVLKVGPEDPGSDGPQIYRSIDGLTWENIAEPTDGIGISGSPLATNYGINNAGEIWVSDNDDLAKYVAGSGWTAAFDPGTSGNNNWLVVGGDGLQFLSASSTVHAKWTDDDWATSSTVTSPGPGTTTEAIGGNTQGPLIVDGIAHYTYRTVGLASRYCRFDLTNGAADAPTTAPSNYASAMGFLLPEKDSPGSIYYAALVGSTINYWHTADNGENWTSIGAIAGPAVGTIRGLTVGSDGKLHAWGYTVALGVVSVKVATLNIDGSGSWSSVATVTTHEGSEMLLATRSYPSDQSIPMQPHYAIVSIVNGATTYANVDIWVVNES